MKIVQNQPFIILVAPQMGENIGAAARAMMNFGLSNLRIVAPRDGWPNQAAIDMAAGAFDVMPAPEIFGTLPEAIADLHYTLATTARVRRMSTTVFSPREAATHLYESHQGSADFRCGIVFGRERTGLENDDIALCQGVINIPANPDFSSFNLGQSVLLLAYEWFLQSCDAPARRFDHGESPPAPQSEIENLWTRLEAALDDGNFFREPDQRPTMARNIRNMLSRAQATSQEVRTFHGMISALEGKKSPPAPKSKTKATTKLTKNKKAAK